MEKQRVLVTGGAGYIGSHACKALHEAGYLPVVYDNLKYGHQWAVKWGPFEHGDIADRQRLDEVLAQHKPIAVMHFAAYAYVGESVEQPSKYYSNNIAATLNLIEAMRYHGVDKFVFSSTCATYGVPESVPIRESQPQNPINPYGFTKLAVERILADYGQAYGLKSVALRYFNAAGADPDTEVGEVHEPETHLIPLVLAAANGDRDAVTVFGDTYPTRDGTCVRDYIHVTDLAAAHLLALEKMVSGEIEREAFNLGNGTGFTVKEVIDTVAAVTGLQVPFEMGPKRAGDPPELIGDASRAIAQLGWKPQYAELDKIIDTAWRWYTEYQKNPR